MMNTIQTDTRHCHQWGFQDTALQLRADRTVQMTGQRYDLSGVVMPELFPFVEEMLAITIDPDDTLQERVDKPTPAPIRNEAFCRAVAAHFPATQYTFAPQARLIHSHGQTTADELFAVLYGALARVVDLVFYCESEADAVALVALAQVHDVCLVPYGGGTSVSGALKLPVHEQRMIVSVDMGRMKCIEWIDQENFRACVQAGITGSELEQELAKAGFVCGHEPDSIELSTLGGWIATNASGMKKNRYGNIEDIVENVTLVTPKGVIEQMTAMPRQSMGMQPNRLLFGSEGTLGLITKAVIRIHRIPETKQYGSIVFPDFQTGVAFLNELTHRGLLPASVRLVDNFQFRFGSALRGRSTFIQALLRRVQKQYLLKLKKFDPMALVVATLVMEGGRQEVAHQAAALFKLAKQYNGVAGGAANGKRGYMLTYAIAYIRDFLMQYYVVGETYETTTAWSNIHTVCAAVMQEAEKLHHAYGLPGKPYVSYRVTQCYHTGVCIYFTHGFYTKGVDNVEEVLRAIDHRLRQVMLDAGGSISHHHGVGKIRADFLPQVLSPASIELLKQTKAALDPQNIFGIGNHVCAE